MSENQDEFQDIILFGGDASHETPSIAQLIAGKLETKSYWVHFQALDPNLRAWLEGESGVEPELYESLLKERVRPKLVHRGDALMVILRVADTLEASEHEELRSLRIYVDQERVISTSIVPLPVVQKMMEKWSNKSGRHATVTELFVDLIVNSVLGLEPILEDLEEEADVLEQQVLDTGADPEDTVIASLALDALHIRRYLAPQREVLSRLYDTDLTWLGSGKKRKIRETYERIGRQLDEVEVLRDRTKIIREQIGSHVAEQVNQRLYIFSLIAFIFVPLGFFTGLLGVNLGGIPGAESSSGFLIFCGLLASVATIMVYVFKRINWV